MAKKVSSTKTRRSPVPAAPAAPAAAAASAAPAAARKAAAKPKLEVSIDYPQEGEAVWPGQYTIRLTAAGATQVQLRVGGGAWIDCRESVGHFWYDWSPSTGEFGLYARARVGKGRWAASPERPCRVI
jgi:hypothetical protein